MMGSQGLIGKTVPHHWWWIPAGFIQELHIPPLTTTKSRALWFINWPRLSFSLSFLADVENEESRQVNQGFNASFLRACTQHLCKKVLECLWVGLCNCVSLQCPIPAIMTAGTIFSHFFFFLANTLAGCLLTSRQSGSCEKWILWGATSVFCCQLDSGNTSTVLWSCYKVLFPLSLVLYTL